MFRTLFLALPCVVALAAPQASAPAPKPATNTICPVMKDKVTEKNPTVVLKGQSYRICCKMCGPKLQASPDKYLNADGTVKPK